MFAASYPATGHHWEEYSLHPLCILRDLCTMIRTLLLQASFSKHLLFLKRALWMTAWTHAAAVTPPSFEQQANLKGQSIHHRSLSTWSSTTSPQWFHADCSWWHPGLPRAWKWFPGLVTPSLSWKMRWGWQACSPLGPPRDRRYVYFQSLGTSLGHPACLKDDGE